MSHPNGSVDFEADGTRYTLRFGINALCRIEERLGVSVMALGETMRSGLDMRTLRTVFACGLTVEQTDEAAGEIMDAIGVQAAGELVGKAFVAAFPTGGDDTDKRPPKAASATGSTG